MHVVTWQCRQMLVLSKWFNILLLFSAVLVLVACESGNRSSVGNNGGGGLGGTRYGFFSGGIL